MKTVAQIVNTGCTWQFFYEDSPETIEFEIKARDCKEAYDVAYEHYGPQVESMFYKPIKPSLGKDFFKLLNPND